MALTLSKVSAYDTGNKRVRVYDVTFDNSYTTGGLALAPTDVGLKTKIEHTSNGHGNVSTTFYETLYDQTNKKLIAFTGAAQATNATDLSTLTVRIRFEGF